MKRRDRSTPSREFVADESSSEENAGEIKRRSLCSVETSTCLEKKVFARLAESQSESKLSLYSRYITHCVDHSSSFGGVAEQLGDEVVAQCYRDKERDERPKFFDLKQYPDICRLEKALFGADDKDRCLLIVVKETFVRRRQLRFHSLYDGRTASSIVKGVNKQPLVVVITMQTRKLKEASVEVVSPGQFGYEYLSSLDLTGHIQLSDSGSTRRTASEALLNLLGMREECVSWAELVMNRELSTDYSLLAVCHRKVKLQSSGSLMEKAGNNQFTHLGNWTSKKNGAALKVALIKALPEGSFTASFIEDREWNEAAVKVPPARATYDSGGDAFHSFQSDISESKRLRRKKIEEAAAREEADEFYCQCSMCREAFFKFPDDESLPPEGPQQSMPVTISSEEYLTIFGMNTKRNRQKLLRVFDLSIAACTRSGVAYKKGGRHRRECRGLARTAR